MNKTTTEKKKALKKALYHGSFYHSLNIKNPRSYVAGDNSFGDGQPDFLVAHVGLLQNIVQFPERGG